MGGKHIRHLLGDGFGVVAIAHNQQAVEHVFAHKTAKRAFKPVIRACHGSGGFAPAFWQGKLHHDEIGVAIVVGKIDFALGGKGDVAFKFGADAG